MAISWIRSPFADDIDIVAVAPQPFSPRDPNLSLVVPVGTEVSTPWPGRWVRSPTSPVLSLDLGPTRYRELGLELRSSHGPDLPLPQKIIIGPLNLIDDPSTGQVATTTEPMTRLYAATGPDDQGRQLLLDPTWAFGVLAAAAGADDPATLFPFYTPALAQGLHLSQRHQPVRDADVPYLDVRFESATRPIAIVNPPAAVGAAHATFLSTTPFEVRVQGAPPDAVVKLQVTATTSAPTAPTAELTTTGSQPITFTPRDLLAEGFPVETYEPGPDGHGSNTTRDPVELELFATVDDQPFPANTVTLSQHPIDRIREEYVDHQLDVPGYARFSTPTRSPVHFDIRELHLRHAYGSHRLVLPDGVLPLGDGDEPEPGAPEVPPTLVSPDLTLDAETFRRAADTLAEGYRRELFGHGTDPGLLTDATARTYGRPDLRIWPWLNPQGNEYDERARTDARQHGHGIDVAPDLWQTPDEFTIGLFWEFQTFAYQALEQAAIDLLKAIESANPIAFSELLLRYNVDGHPRFEIRVSGSFTTSFALAPPEPSEIGIATVDEARAAASSISIRFVPAEPVATSAIEVPEPVIAEPAPVGGTGRNLVLYAVEAAGTSYQLPFDDSAATWGHWYLNSPRHTGDVIVEEVETSLQVFERLGLFDDDPAPVRNLVLEGHMSNDGWAIVNRMGLDADPPPIDPTLRSRLQLLYGMEDLARLFGSEFQAGHAFNRVHLRALPGSLRNKLRRIFAGAGTIWLLGCDPATAETGITRISPLTGVMARMLRTEVWGAADETIRIAQRLDGRWVPSPESRGDATDATLFHTPPRVLAYPHHAPADGRGDLGDGDLEQHHWAIFERVPPPGRDR